ERHSENSRGRLRSCPQAKLAVHTVARRRSGESCMPRGKQTMRTTPMSFLFSWLLPRFRSSSIVVATGENNSKRTALHEAQTARLCVEVEDAAPNSRFGCICVAAEGRLSSLDDPLRYYAKEAARQDLCWIQKLYLRT